MGKPASLARDQRRALADLREIVGTDRFYLAGGTAIASHLGHRRSLDLDLFSFARDADLSQVLDAARAGLPRFHLVAESEAVLRIRTGDVPVDLVRYAYDLLDPPSSTQEGFPVANLRDLAAMKLAAIARRGLRRDFWDLRAICDAELTLRGAIDAYQQKFGGGSADLYHLLRSLTFFDDAERDPVLPRGMSAKRWGAVKAFFLAEAPRLLAAR
jgi:hypothetical protein